MRSSTSPKFAPVLSRFLFAVAATPQHSTDMRHSSAVSQRSAIRLASGKITCCCVKFGPAEELQACQDSRAAHLKFLLLFCFEPVAAVQVLPDVSFVSCVSVLLVVLQVEQSAEPLVQPDHEISYAQFAEANGDGFHIVKTLR